MRHDIRLLVAVLAFGITGCNFMPRRDVDPLPPIPPEASDYPRELSKSVYPTYVIQPPDLLVIEAINIVPKAPYYLRTGDLVTIKALGTLELNDINGEYAIQPGGIINLGPEYGSVKVSGLTAKEAEQAVLETLEETLREPDISLELAQIAGQQQIAGQHLVGPDGTVTLGSYGSVSVVGMTISQAKIAIENHLQQFLDQPEVAVDIFGYNSLVYYIIVEGAGLGDGVTRIPCVGNETVLDAISQINGLTEVSSKRIWIARPTPNSDHVQILPVDWKSVTAQAGTGTNWQVFPGDRVFIAEDKLVAFDTRLGKMFSPFERIFGFSILGANTVSRFSGNVLRGGGLRGFNSGTTTTR